MKRPVDVRLGSLGERAILGNHDVHGGVRHGNPPGIENTACNGRAGSSVHRRIRSGLGSFLGS